LEDFERDLTDLEGRLQSESITFPTSDVQRLLSELTRTQTTIVTKRTKLETRLTTLSRLVEERKKKLREIEDLEAMLGDLQHWTTTTQNIVDSKTDSDLSRKEISSKIEELEVNIKGDKVFFLKG
jgi:hypothetical protein